jgi:hypothetical protein
MKRLPESRLIVVTPAPEPDAYVVDIEASTRTQHRVTIGSSYLAELGLVGISAARILEVSFRFLLEREANTSILTRFELRDIERYFPEFRQEIGRRLK